MAIRVFVSSQMAVHLQSGKSWAWHLFPSPNPLFLLPLLLSLHQSFVAHPFSPPLLCRRFDIGNTVSALHGNNSGKDDMNYLPIVWHMQGIVLAIIISTLSPEGMNGATAALCLSAKLRGLFRAPALLVKPIHCTCPPSHKEEWITIMLLNCKASALAFCWSSYTSLKNTYGMPSSHCCWSTA